MSVYKLICNETGKVYYGSTKRTLKTRKRDGWKTCSCKDFVNPTIELVETVDDLNNLLERENYYITNFECINKKRAMRTDEEKKEYWKQYREDNREIINKKHKEHYLNNREEIRSKNRQHYLKVKDVKLEKQKEYRKNNLEKLRAIEKKYRDKNKEKILARRREQYRLKKLKEKEKVK